MVRNLWLDGGVLRGYYGEGGEVVLPDFVYDVGGYVFRNHTRVTSVVIPDGAIDVGYGAFSGCSGLTKVVLPDSILRIDMYAFSRCDHLTEVRLPAKQKILRDSTFIHCSALRRVWIPDTLESIEFHAFYGCDALTEIQGLGVTSVEDPIIDRTAKCILPNIPIAAFESQAMQYNGALGYCTHPELYKDTATEYAQYVQEHADALIRAAVQSGFSEPLRYFDREGLLSAAVDTYLELAQQTGNAEIIAFLLDCSARAKGASEDVWAQIDREFEL